MNWKWAFVTFFAVYAIFQIYLGAYYSYKENIHGQLQVITTLLAAILFFVVAIVAIL